METIRKMFRKQQKPVPTNSSPAVSQVSRHSLPSRRTQSLCQNQRSRRSLNFSPLGMDQGMQSYGPFTDDDAVASAQFNAENDPEPESGMAREGVLTVESKVEHSSLPKDRQVDVFGLVTVKSMKGEDVPVTTVKDRVACDIVVVADVSGSMGGDKIKLLRDATAFMTRELGDRDRLSLVTFSHVAQRVTPLKRMSANGKDETLSEIFRLSSGGGTSIASGVKCGLDVLEARRSRNQIGSLFLLTDGQDGSCLQYVPALIEKARAIGCSIYTFGFGNDHDTRVMNAFAEAAGTPFTFIEQLDAVRDAFAGATSGLMSINAQQVDLRLTAVGEGARIKRVHTHFANTVADDGSSATVQIPDMFAGEQRNVLVELSLPAVSAVQHATVLSVNSSYKDLKQRALVHAPPCTMELTRSAEQDAAEPEPEVTVQRQRVQTTNTLEQAVRLGDEGRFEEAQQLIETQQANVCGGCDMSNALREELADAKSRLTRNEWTDGGCAEVADAVQMHKWERCTNDRVSMKAKSRGISKRSKGLYLQSAQKECISRCG